jgi:hypothetical protein
VPAKRVRRASKKTLPQRPQLILVHLGQKMLSFEGGKMINALIDGKIETNNCVVC